MCVNEASREHSCHSADTKPGLFNHNEQLRLSVRVMAHKQKVRTKKADNTRLRRPRELNPGTCVRHGCSLFKAPTLDHNVNNTPVYGAASPVSLPTCIGRRVVPRHHVALTTYHTSKNWGYFMCAGKAVPYDSYNWPQFAPHQQCYEITQLVHEVQLCV